jgi:DNA-binding response OmpR family regulator
MNGKAVLILDDNANDCALLTTMLEGAGFSVIKAHDGLEALRAYKMLQTSIILVLINPCVPKTNGLDFAERVLQLDPRVPVLCTSGEAWSSDGGFGPITKPFRPMSLMARISPVLNAASYRRQESGNLE